MKKIFKVIEHIKTAILKAWEFIKYKLFKREREFSVYEVNKGIRAKGFPYFLVTDGDRLFVITQHGFTPLFSAQETEDKITAYFDGSILILEYTNDEILISPKGEVL